MYAIKRAIDGIGFEKFFDKGSSIVPITSQTTAPSK